MSRFRAALLLVLLLGLGTWAALRAQRPFRQYNANQYENFPLPDDWQDPHGWVFGRLRYRAAGRFGRGFGGGSWSTDYPRSDRHLLQGIRRLTRVDARSVEQVVDLDGEDDVYNWPFLYGVEVGRWTLSESEAAQLRDFLDRGGFLMVDDFHGMFEWQVFMASLQRVFPDRTIVDLQDSDPIFHTLYDLEHRFQVPGAQYIRTGRTYERADGVEAIWRGIYDDKGRLMVAICHNMDLGDAWEWSDDPAYPEPMASLAYRIAINYVIYDLTH